jgi:rhodanese-related sulfurtransferase
MASQDIPRMTPQELFTRMEQGEPIVIIDVRTEDALSVHPHQIPGARWVPLPAVVQQTETLPRHRTVVAYCT